MLFFFFAPRVVENVNSINSTFSYVSIPVHRPTLLPRITLTYIGQLIPILLFGSLPPISQHLVLNIDHGTLRS